jgi:hypothetical protein
MHQHHIVLACESVYVLPTYVRTTYTTRGGKRLTPKGVSKGSDVYRIDVIDLVGVGATSKRWLALHKFCSPAGNQHRVWQLASGTSNAKHPNQITLTAKLDKKV